MTPCMDCKDRKVGCHATCERYQGWNRSRKAILDKRLKAHLIDCGIAEVHELGRKTVLGTGYRNLKKRDKNKR